MRFGKQPFVMANMVTVDVGLDNASPTYELSPELLLRADEVIE